MFGFIKRIKELERRVSELEKAQGSGSLSDYLNERSRQEYMESFFGGGFEEVMDGKEAKDEGTERFMVRG